MSADRPDATSRGTTRSGRLRAAGRHVLPNLAPWRSSRDFRLQWTSGLVTRFGSYFTYVAVPLQIARMTGSPVAVGLVGLVQLLPMVVFGLWGGALADAVNRRLLILGTEAGLSVLTVLLLANSLLPHPQLWLLYMVAGLTAMLDAVQRPALDALTPQIVHHDHLAAASALQSLRKKAAAVLSPALAGLVAASVGLSAAYAVDLASFLVSLLLLFRLRTIPVPGGGDRPSLAAIVAALGYAWSRKDLLGSYVVDIIAMMFAFPSAIFPFLAVQLHTPWALGMLYSAGAVGAVTVSATSGWYSRVQRHGRAVLVAAAATGAAVVAAGLSPNVWLVLVFLAVAGGADTVSGLGRDTMWNQSIPDKLRGRMAGVELLSYLIGPRLGDVRSGLMAARWGAQGSMWTGGLAGIAGIAILAATLPAMLGYDARTDVNATAIRARRRIADTGDEAAAIRPV